MTHFEAIFLSSFLALLILIAAFFSAAETSLMAINRYRLRHRARLKKRSALLILNLLKRPDRLLGMILIGNNFSNILASAIATLLAVHFWGDKGIVVSTILLTLVILIFAEVTPKTLAALNPDRISKWVAWPVFVLLKLFYPFVWFINAISNGILRLFRVKLSQHMEPLSREELRTVVYETAGRVSHQYQDMLLNILDLNKVVVDDVMIPRHEIVGVDLDQSWENIESQLAGSEHDWLPVYRDNINQTTGILHLRDLSHALVTNELINKEMLLKVLKEPYFVPIGTPLNTQLIHFQRKRKRMALVVDEYGEIQGLITLEDILEEIVGEFTTNVPALNKIIELQPDGSYLADGAITIRELNRATHWELPKRGPRTLSGLIIEHLEAIPRQGICILIADHPIEIIDVTENRVKTAKVFPKKIIE